jgi:hypothetical protein
MSIGARYLRKLWQSWPGRFNHRGHSGRPPRRANQDNQQAKIRNNNSQALILSLPW